MGKAITMWWRKLCGTYLPPSYTFTYLSPLAIKKGSDVIAGGVIMGRVARCDPDADTLGFNVKVNLHAIEDFEWHG